MRDYVVNGETLITLLFGSHISIPGSTHVGSNKALFELGLASEKVTISPTLKHKDMHCDDFGPDIPADVMFMLAYVTISFTLIQYDESVLDSALGESMGGVAIGPTLDAGIMQGAGIPLGGLKRIGANGCHYVSLNLASPVLGIPWRFRASYMPDSPMILPLGTEKSMAVCTFRAIPYFQNNQVVLGGGSTLEIASAGVTLWDRTLDT